MIDRNRYKEGNTHTFRRAQATTSRFPTMTTAGIGGTALRLPAGRNVLPPISGVMPTSTISTASAFGGTNGGVGAIASPIGPTMLSGIGSSFSKAGVGIMNTLGSFIPLAIKIILAVIVIKIVLWLIKRR